MDWETWSWCCMMFQESVAIVFLDLVLVFFSDEACFTLKAILITETVIGILKSLCSS
jgi:hypothetical protein